MVWLYRGMDMKPLALALALASSAVFAHTPYSIAECQQFGTMVNIIATVRDRGVDQVTNHNGAIETMLKFVDYPKFFVKDEGDVDMVLNAIPLVYDNPKLTPQALQAAAYDECVRVLVPGLLTKKGY
jgi:hypothetical protein